MSHAGPARPAAPILEIEGLSVDYGVGERALHAVVGADLAVKRGGVVGLAGESGSGKSTLAYASTRLLREPGVVVGGRVLFRPRSDTGHDPVVDMLAAGESELRAVRWSRLSVVFQSAMNALNPVLRVSSQFDNVLKAHHGDWSADQRRARAAELLKMVGISDARLRDYSHGLSGGQRQRVMIGLALALEPDLVIMDEPTTALDVVTQREILEELVQLRDRVGFSLLFITHDLSLLIEVTDEISVMYAGRIVERAASTSLFHAPRHPYTYGLINSFPKLHGERRYMTGIPGSPPDLRHVPNGCPFHPRCPYALDRCRTDPPPFVTIDGSDHQVACWLHGDRNVPPAALALPDPKAAP